MPRQIQVTKLDVDPAPSGVLLVSNLIYRISSIGDAEQMGNLALGHLARPRLRSLVKLAVPYAHTALSPYSKAG